MSTLYYYKSPNTLNNQGTHNSPYLWLGVCKLSPKPTTSTSTNPSALPLAPTDGADAGDRNTNGAPMLVR